jgi:hypothetical protein
MRQVILVEEYEGLVINQALQGTLVTIVTLG